MAEIGGVCVSPELIVRNIAHHPALRSPHGVRVLPIRGSASDLPAICRRPCLRYAAAAGPNQVVSASSNAVSAESPTHATCPSGRISTAVGALTAPSTGSSQAPV